MSSERRSVEGELPDGVADRAQGYTHNPNPDDEIAANRARFEAKQQELQQDRQAVAEQIREVQHKVEGQYEASMHDPAHAAFMPEQIAHAQSDPLYSHGGVERDGGDEPATVMPNNLEIGKHVPMPTTPRRAEEFNNEESD